MISIGTTHSTSDRDETPLQLLNRNSDRKDLILLSIKMDLIHGLSVALALLRCPTGVWTANVF